MERFFIKTALYSFLLGLAAALLIYSDKTVSMQTANTSIITDLPLREYMLKLLRFAVRIMFIALGAAAVWRWSGIRRQQTSASFTASFAKGFVVTAAAIALVLAVTFSISLAR